MRLGITALWVAAGCGRIGFDAGGRALDAAGSSDAARDAAEPAIPAGAGIWLQMETDPTSGIIDSAGGHTAFCQGACPTRIAGVHGSGYKFVIENVTIQYAPDLDTSAGFTAAIWVQVANVTAQASPFFKPFGGGAFDTFAIIFEPGDMFFDSDNPGGAGDQIYDSPAVQAWHHYAETWDGTTKRGYVDGVLVQAHAVAIGVGTDDFGMCGTTPAATMTVDDAIYYPRALSATEIMQLATP